MLLAKSTGQTFEVWCRFGYYGGWTVEVNTGAARAVTERHTDYCNPPAHAQRVNNIVANCPRMAGIVPDFGPMSQLCPGLPDFIA